MIKQQVFKVIKGEKISGLGCVFGAKLRWQSHVLLMLLHSVVGKKCSFC